MPSETDSTSAKMELLYDYYRRKNLPLVVASDTNSHHPLWGSDSANNRGNRLCEFLATTDLEVVNVVVCQHTVHGIFNPSLMLQL